MIGAFEINGVNSYTQFGIYLDQKSLTALLTPLAVKKPIENESVIADGKEVFYDEDPKVESRTIQLTLNMTAASEADFITKYDAFCAELEKQQIVIRITDPKTVYFRFVYHDCKQFQTFFKRNAKFALTLEEPNPKNRAQTDITESESNNNS